MLGCLFLLAWSLLSSLDTGKAQDVISLPGTYGKCGDMECDNYGVCKIKDNKTYCVCPSGWDGQICQTKTQEEPCPLTCLNEGICKIVYGEPKCVCPDLFIGSLCQIIVPESACVYHICKNGGQCKLTEGVPNCKCASGFRGRFCELIDYCAEFDCYNGGLCKNLIDAPECQCLPGFYGIHCDLTDYLDGSGGNVHNGKKDEDVGNDVGNNGTTVSTGSRGRKKNRSWRC